MIKRITIFAATALLALAMAVPAFAAPLPDNCTRDQATVICPTTEGPLNNELGLRTTETAETHRNTKNKPPDESQNLQDACVKKPPKAQGGAIGECPPA